MSSTETDGNVDGYGFINYQVHVEPSDIGEPSPAFREFVKTYGHVVGLTAADLPAFTREVQRTYATGWGGNPR